MTAGTLPKLEHRTATISAKVREYSTNHVIHFYLFIYICTGQPFWQSLFIQSVLDTCIIFCDCGQMWVRKRNKVFYFTDCLSEICVCVHKSEMSPIEK
jgi:hypothetical protein